MPRCKAKAKSGDQCRNNAIPGTTSCYLKSHGSTNAKFHRRVLNYVRNHWIGAASLLLGILSLVLYFRDKKLESTSGYLTAFQPAIKKYISVGATRFIVDSPDNVFLRDGEVPLLSLRISNNKLLVSTQIRNENGELVAEIKDNEWKLNKNTIFDQNHTDHILEIRDAKGRIMLQVIDFGDSIHLAGIFRCKNGWTTTLGPVGEYGAIMDIRPPGVEPNYAIEPVCEYPSDQHFGSCPGVDSLSKYINHEPYGPAYRLMGSLNLCTKPAK